MFSTQPNVTINGQLITDVRLAECWKEPTNQQHPYRAEITYADGRQVRYRAARLLISGNLTEGQQYTLVDAISEEPDEPPLRLQVGGVLLYDTDDGRRPAVYLTDSDHPRGRRIGT